jgi:flagellin
MLSLLTNAPAMTALAGLSQTQTNLQTTEAQAATGLKVSNASEGAAYWSIATKMQSEIGARQTIVDDLAESLAIAEVTYTALASIISDVDAIQKDVIAAQQPGVDKASLQLDIAARQNQIVSTANSAVFNGQNWLVDNWNVNENFQQTTSFSDTLADIAAIQQNWNGSFTQTDTTTTSGSFSDNWGNSTSGTVTSTTTSTYTYSNQPNSLGGTDYFLNFSTSTSTSGSGPGEIPASFADIPIDYNAASGTGFLDISKSALKLFDNYSEAAGSTGAPATQFSSYQSPAGVPYDPSLPEQGLGLLTESFSGAPAISAVAPTPGSPPPSSNRYFINGVQQVPVSGSTGPSFGVSQNLLTLDITALSDSDLNQVLAVSSDVLNQLTNMTATLGADINTIQNQQTFVTSAVDSLTNGVSSLVDADMNEVSTRLAALQVQQQLGVTSLNIANSNAKIILLLFEGKTPS